MLIKQAPMVTEVTSHICDYHKRNPQNRNYAGCTCSTAYVEKIKPIEDWTEDEKRQYYRED